MTPSEIKVQRKKKNKKAKVCQEQKPTGRIVLAVQSVFCPWRMFFLAYVPVSLPCVTVRIQKINSPMADVEGEKMEEEELEKV